MNVFYKSDIADHYSKAVCPSCEHNGSTKCNAGLVLKEAPGIKVYVCEGFERAPKEERNA